MNVVQGEYVTSNLRVTRADAVRKCKDAGSPGGRTSARSGQERQHPEVWNIDGRTYALIHRPRSTCECIRERMHCVFLVGEGFAFRVAHSRSRQRRCSEHRLAHRCPLLVYCITWDTCLTPFEGSTPYGYSRPSRAARRNPQHEST